MKADTSVDGEEDGDGVGPTDVLGADTRVVLGVKDEVEGFI